MRLHRLNKDARETDGSKISENDGQIGASFTMGKGSKHKKIFFASFDWSDVEALIEAFGKAGTVEAKKLLQARRLAASLGTRPSRSAKPPPTPRPRSSG